MAKEMNYEALNANLKMLDRKGELAFEQARAAGTLTPEQEKFSALISDEAFMEKFFAADSAAEAAALFKENGLPLSEEDVNAFGKYLVGISKRLIENGGELSEEELEEVAGGLAESFSTSTPGERLFTLGMMFACASVGMAFAGEAGFALGTAVCPGIGSSIGGTIGAIGGAFGGIVLGIHIGVPVARGIKKVGSWIKGLF